MRITDKQLGRFLRKEWACQKERRRALAFFRRAKSGKRAWETLLNRATRQGVLSPTQGRLQGDAVYWLDWFWVHLNRRCNDRPYHHRFVLTNQLAPEARRVFSWAEVTKQMRRGSWRRANPLRKQRKTRRAA